jgi:hypothetical protein
VRIGTAVLAISLLAGSASSQTPRPTRGPEQSRLENLEGRWTIEGESGGDRFTRTETCEWFSGGFHLICRSDAAGAGGAVKGQSIIGYDPEGKIYTFYFISSTGTAISVGYGRGAASSESAPS